MGIPITRKTTPGDRQEEHGAATGAFEGLSPRSARNGSETHGGGRDRRADEHRERTRVGTEIDPIPPGRIDQHG